MWNSTRTLQGHFRATSGTWTVLRQQFPQEHRFILVWLEGCCAVCISELLLSAFSHVWYFEDTFNSHFSLQRRKITWSNSMGSSFKYSSSPHFSTTSVPDYIFLCAALQFYTRSVSSINFYIMDTFLNVLRRINTFPGKIAHNQGNHTISQPTLYVMPLQVGFHLSFIYDIREIHTTLGPCR